jgi:alkyldihydroxyacetonephosphate synthase
MDDETARPVTGLRPYRWGDPVHEVGLPTVAAAALKALGVLPPPDPVDPAAARVPDTALPAAALDALRAVVGPGHVRTDHTARVAHTRGWSTPDLLRLRAGEAADAPDAVVYPAGHDEVVRVLEVCSEHRVAVVPYAGGTSVVGGLAPARAGFAGVLALDVARLDALTELDECSRTATVQAGVRGPAAEARLRERGYTLGHFPQSYEGASIGGYAAARSAGQASAGYGRFDELVVGLVLATPRGTIRLGTAPRSAAGPDLRQLVLGSEGTLGVITSVTVRIRPVPAVRVYEGWRFTSFAAGTDALRRLAQDGPRPTVLRLSDEAETAISAALAPAGPEPAPPAAASCAGPEPAGSSDTGTGPAGPAGHRDGKGGGSAAGDGGPPGSEAVGAGGGCLAVVGYEGSAADVAARRAGASAVLRAAGGTDEGTAPGEAWRAGRFGAPYLRDALLDAGALVETLETATFWSGLAALRGSVTRALTETLAGLGTPAVVLCHVSHVYETGASLYFTVLCARASDPLAQWAAAKAAASSAIRECGATTSHHHGVGTDHREAYHAEIGPLALEALRAVKQVLDPAGVLNPGVLL